MDYYKKSVYISQPSRGEIILEEFAINKEKTLAFHRKICHQSTFGNYVQREECVVRSLPNLQGLENNLSSRRILQTPALKLQYTSENQTESNKEMSNKHSVKHRNRNKSKETKETKSILVPVDSSYRKLLLSLFGAAILLTLIPAYFLNETYNNSDHQTLYKAIEGDVKQQMLHQEDAVIVVLNSINDAYLWPQKVKVLAFIGSSGVGKSHLAHLVKRNFDQRLVHEITFLDLRDSKKCDDVIGNLRNGIINLVIIEDLTMSDFNLVYGFVKRIPEEKHVLVLALFGIQEVLNPVKHRINEHHIVGIRDMFDGSDLYHEIVLFYPLKTETLKVWVDKELKKRNIRSEKYDEIYEFVKNNIDVPNTGLKRAERKLSLVLGEQ